MDLAVDSVMISNLKKVFYEQISSLQPCHLAQAKSTLSLLTDEELKELEQLWVEFVVWKNSQS